MTSSYSKDNQKYISVEGIDNALKVAKTLLEQDYEVMIELEDCNIYIVHFAEAKYKNYGNDAFYRVSEEDMDSLYTKYHPIEEDE